MTQSNEQLITELVGFVSEMVPVNVEDMRGKLSGLLATYAVEKVEDDETHPDLTDNIKLYLANKKLEGMALNSLKSYRYELNTFSTFIKKRTEDITAGDIRIYLAQFEHLKLSSLSKKLTVLKSFFGWITGEEIIMRDPTIRLKAPKKEQRAPKSLSIEELEMLREVCKLLRERALLEVFYATGCRLSEIQALNKDDINLQSMSCRVIGKGNKEREVFFSFKAMYHLRKYLMTRTDDQEALFITLRKPYRRVGHRAIQREFKRIAERIGLGHKVHPHVCRHTFATLTLNNGADIVAVQQLLGHSSPATTQTYAVLSDERKREQHKKYLVQ
ncbi:integrase [Jeotgalibacillus alimentarius]|uniref:Integrase n=1 Tax=Jeotgalibacillus alimentarius TaxID=135826 RepID=A0A0C2R9B2_9BACL|nr:site-specific tyrosine recombinase/integron integrase [Jeotgalibacillus alimentarius]KIL46920.1 integrase [Jeotgalibacillus alimentarius]